MVARSVRKSNPPTVAAPTLEVSFQRIADLLALLLVKGEGETDKVLALTGVGYTPGEIGKLLGKQPNTVSVLLYKAKQEQKRKSSK